MDVNDIRPDDLMAQKKPCVDADRRFLLAGRGEWLRVSCPACHVANSKPFGEKDGFRYEECGECGTVYTNPRPPLSFLHEFYSQSQNYAFWNDHIFPATESVRREQIFRPRAERLAHYCSKHGVVSGSLLDVGAAFGTFCGEVKKTGLFERVIALEPAQKLAATCRDRGFDVWECFIEDVSKEEKLNVISAFEVIEHLFSPEAFLRDCVRLLSDNGLLVLSCPNVRGFDMATLGILSGSFDHEHLNYFHPKSLVHLLSRCGFEVLEVETPGRLDVDVVHRMVVRGDILFEEPFLRHLFVERFDELREPFQDFLAANCLSSHMWAIARLARESSS